MGSAEQKHMDKPFRQGLFELDGDNVGHLVGNRCDRCKISFFPKRKICSNCFEDDKMIDVLLGKKGVLYTYTIVYLGKPEFEVPYVVGYIDLEDGVRIFSLLFEVANEDLKIGMEMELVFKNMADVLGFEEALVYGFRPTIN